MHVAVALALIAISLFLEIGNGLSNNFVIIVLNVPAYETINLIYECANYAMHCRPTLFSCSQTIIIQVKYLNVRRKQQNKNVFGAC